LNTDILQLKSKIAGLDREINLLRIEGKNKVDIIRSKLSTLNLNDDEDVSDLEIDSAAVEMTRLAEISDKLKEKKEQLRLKERDLKKIQDSLR